MTVAEQIAPMGRLELYMALNLISGMEPDTEDLMRERAEREFVEDEHDSPHSRAWHLCLGGDTEVVTRQGIKMIRNLVGDADLLVPEKNQSRRGRFMSCEIKSYGVAPTLIVNLRRHKQTKRIVCTPSHRWYLEDGGEVQSVNLKPGDGLRPLAASLSAKRKPVPFAFAQGFVYGDGTTRLDGRPAHLDLYHNGKYEALIDRFCGHVMVDHENLNGMKFTRIKSLPRSWNDLPRYDESRSFLMSWLAGYFAADGCVDTRGYCSISSASLKSINFVRDALAICGVGHGQIKYQLQSGTYPHGAAYQDHVHYSLRVTTYDLPEWFFLQEKHRERAMSNRHRQESSERYWRVESVEPGEDQEVFCATVPDHGVFGLADQLMTGNSFHASQFPGDPLEACARKLVYRMMNIPSGEGAMAPWITSTGAVGKAGELDIVDAWYKGGRMLGVPEDPRRPDVYQLGFVDRDHWLTGSTDLAILKPGWTRPHVVEIKGKADDVLVEMIEGRPMQRDGIVVNEPRPPDEAHVRQLKATLGLAHEYDWGWVTVCRHSWRILWAELIARLDPSSGGLVLGQDNHMHCPEHGYDCQHAFQLEPPTTGEIYYWSRSWPRGNPRLGQRTKSFFYEYDPAYMEGGRAILREAREHFEAGTLPPRHESFQWSIGPCQNCQAKPFCRLDEGLEPRKRKPTMDKITTLAESNGVEYARSLRPGYDLESVRERVLAEWRAPVDHEFTDVGSTMVVREINGKYARVTDIFGGHEVWVLHDAVPSDGGQIDWTKAREET